MNTSNLILNCQSLPLKNLTEGIGLVLRHIFIVTIQNIVVRILGELDILMVVTLAYAAEVTAFTQLLVT